MSSWLGLQYQARIPSYWSGLKSKQRALAITRITGPFLVLSGHLTELFVTVGWGIDCETGAPLDALQQEWLSSWSKWKGKQMGTGGLPCFYSKAAPFPVVGPDLSLSQLAYLRSDGAWGMGKKWVSVPRPWGSGNETLCGEGSKPLSISGEARTFAFYTQAILGGLEDLHSRS